MLLFGVRGRSVEAQDERDSAVRLVNLSNREVLV